MQSNREKEIPSPAHAFSKPLCFPLQRQPQFSIFYLFVRNMYSMHTHAPLVYFYTNYRLRYDLFCTLHFMPLVGPDTSVHIDTPRSL